MPADGARPAPATPEAADIERKYGGTPDSVVAGYHWFGAWGRDTLIALPGLTFYAGRRREGEALLARMGQAARDGLIPNLLLPDGTYRIIDTKGMETEGFRLKRKALREKYGKIR